MKILYETSYLLIVVLITLFSTYCIRKRKEKKIPRWDVTLSFLFEILSLASSLISHNPLLRIWFIEGKDFRYLAHIFTIVSTLFLIHWSENILDRKINPLMIVLLYLSLLVCSISYFTLMRSHIVNGLEFETCITDGSRYYLSMYSIAYFLSHLYLLCLAIRLIAHADFTRSKIALTLLIVYSLLGIIYAINEFSFLFSNSLNNTFLRWLVSSIKLTILPVALIIGTPPHRKRVI